MTAAVPNYVAEQLGAANPPPGHRFRLYFEGWTEGWALGNKTEAIQRCLRIFDRAALQSLVERQRALASRTTSLVHQAVLGAPLATGLGNPHPLENGLSFLDPHGLPVLPGSSIKGAVRAEAEAMALRDEEGWTVSAVWWLFGFDENSSWHRATHRDAFAHALGREPRERLEAFADFVDERHAKALRADPVAWLLRARPEDLPRVRGALRFWDAFPVVSQLDVDIMTPHHSGYLQPDEPGPPLDHEEPTPIPFLVVPAGAKLDFIVELSAPRATPEWLRQTWKQLVSGALRRTLRDRGFGAKTVLGFGRTSVEQSANARCVELVAPGFIGGADPTSASHTTLRASSLRGELRWWWRTMHAGFLTTGELRELEDAFWGSVRTGRSVVSVQVTPVGRHEVILAPYKRRQGTKVDIDRTFLEQHRMEAGQRGPGIAYAAYGMADGNKHRYVVCPGARFLVALKVDAPWRRKAVLHGELSPEDVEGEVLAAWQLLCAWGGVGAKARKGFGSLHEVSQHGQSPVDVIHAARREAQQLRAKLGLGDRKYDGDRAAGALSLDALAAAPAVVALSHDDPWWAMNAIGDAARSVASDWKHSESKVALGLPRQIHGPRPEPRPNQRNHRPPKQLRGTAPVRNRHASPVRICLGRSASGNLEVRVLAFVAGKLPNPQESRRTLEQFVTLFQQRLQTQPQAPARDGRQPRGGGQAPRATAPVTRSVAPAPQHGQRVQVVLGRTKKGGWKGTFEEGGYVYSGPIIQGEPPDGVREGDTVEVIIRSVTAAAKQEREAQFVWPPKS